ncbi:MAG: GTPase HflX [Acidobacteria bacterium]|nr:GTPase HflX [Acidobacteriota bacterium]
MEVATPDRENVILVGCELKRSVAAAAARGAGLNLEESLDELAALASAARARVAARLLQQRARYDPAFLIGKGKLERLKGLLDRHRADTVIFDDNLSPAQQRNIERALDCKVVDRTQLILDIFASRARTREGKLQVELAQLDYWLPRLGGRGVELSRLGGGIGTRGPGETKLETDQRKIHQRIHKIKRDLKRVRGHRQLHRSFRQSVPIPTVSLVGYTNAGKSTLFNALTQSDTLASRQLFATLDPLLRRIRLPSKREVILSDTVGFISKLPATLVSAFRATLEEIGEAQLLLHVIDCSSPRAEHQRDSVHKVLEELGDSDKPILEVYNKTDLLEQPPRLTTGDNALRVSALRHQGISRLMERIDESIDGDPLVRAQFRVGAHQGDLLARIHASGRLVSRQDRGSRILLEVEAPRSVVEKLRQLDSPSREPG